MRKLAVLCSVGFLMLALAACSGDENGEQVGEKADGSRTESLQGSDGEQPTEAAYEANLQSVKTALRETLKEAYLPNAEIKADELAETYGITADMYDAAFAERAGEGAVDTVILVLAKEGQTDAVEEAMNAYRDLMVNDTTQTPENRNKIQASRIERIGNYVCYVQLGATAAIGAEAIDDEIIMQCQEQNELAIAVIEQNVRHY